MCLALNSRRTVTHQACGYIGVCGYKNQAIKISQVPQSSVYKDALRGNLIFILNFPMILVPSSYAPGFFYLNGYLIFISAYPLPHCSPAPDSDAERQILIICNFSQPPFFPLIPTVSHLQSIPFPQVLTLTLTTSGLFCAQSNT